MNHTYHFRRTDRILFTGKRDSVYLEVDLFREAISRFDETIGILSGAVGDLFHMLGMRNLSAFVGEIFVDALAKTSSGILIKNPHQDGYPDLLVMTNEGRQLLDTLRLNMQDKKPFSDFLTGGIEVKSTCGSVPTPRVLETRGLRKPEIGEQRIGLLTGYDWKAHHRLTNNLVGIVWDFIDRVPVITGIFFCSDLTEEDWGKIIHPKEGGGRTTSVSIMTRHGIYKMYENWLAVIADSRYIGFFNRYNRANLIDNSSMK